MIRTSRPLLTLSCVLILTAFAGCSIGSGRQAREKEIRTVTVPHVEGRDLHVKTTNGHVTVRHEDRDDVQISAHLRMITRQRLADTEILATRNDAGTHTLAERWSANRFRRTRECPV